MTNDSKQDRSKPDAYGCRCPDGPEESEEVLRRWPRECATHGTAWSPDLPVERQGVEW